MRLVIEGRPGRIFYSEGHPDFHQILPVYCFLPEDVNPVSYLSSRWPSINASANPNAIGSHVFPDLNRPARNTACPTLRLFLQNLPRFIAKASSE